MITRKLSERNFILFFLSEIISSKTGEILNKIVRGIMKVSDSMIEMKNAMAELSIGSHQIMKSLEIIVKTTMDELILNNVFNVSGISPNLSQISSLNLSRVTISSISDSFL